MMTRSRPAVVAALAACALLPPLLLPVVSSAAPTRAGHDARANGRIAFSTGYVGPDSDPDDTGPAQVFSVEPDGSNAVQLTHVPKGKQAGDPSWSRDGSRIAYVANTSGRFGIWVMAADGSGQHQVAAATKGFDLYTPTWSPDDKELLARRCHRIGYVAVCRVAVLNADGLHLRELTDDYRNDSDPTFAPDGRHIAFTSDRAGLSSAIWVMRRDGSHLHRLTSAALEAFWPRWSPHGRRIVFTSACCNPNSQVYVMHADGSHVHALTRLGGGHQAALPDFSPDGRRVVFLSDLRRSAQGPDNDLFTMRADGSDIRALVTNHPRVVRSDWGPAS